MTSPPTSDDGREFDSPVDAALAAALLRAGEELRHVPAGVAASHLDAIAALAATHSHAGPTAGARPTWRSRWRRLVGLTAFKVALGAGVAAAATTGGLAATGNLPDPVQRAVSDGARWVGVDLPAPMPSSTVPADEDASADVTTSRPEAPATAPVDDEPGPPAGTPAPAEVSPADDPESSGSPAPGAPPTRPGPDASPHPRSSPPADGPRDPSTPSAPPPHEPTPGARASASAVGGRVPTGATEAGTGTSGTGH